MIILDTNVVSEPMKSKADAAVIEWLDRQAAETLYLTATSLSELLLGIEVLPPGKRRRSLADDLASLLASLFGSRILPFDADAARRYPALVARARAAGRSISVGDGQIAAIAAMRGFSVATRDTSPFASVGAAVIDPWRSSPEPG